MEGLIYGGKFVFQSLIVGRKFTIFALFYFVFEGNFQVQATGGLKFGGAIYQRVFALRVWIAYIWKGLYLDGLIFGILQYGTKLKKLVNGKRISVRNIPTENGTTFSEFSFVPGIFLWDKPRKPLPFASQQEFPGYLW